MKLKVAHQGAVFLAVLTLIRCEYQKSNVEVKNDEFHQASHNVIEHGRIVSKPVTHPIPVDQAHTADIQHDENSSNKPKYNMHGDILIPIEEIVEFVDSKRIKRKIVAETNRYGNSNRWPRGVVPYEFISGIDYRVQQNVLSAIQHWHQHTCIRFEPYDPDRHSDIASKIIIEDTGSGCATFVGYRPLSTDTLSSYSVYLPLQCPLGSAIHELGHVIGYYHEMARTDRDQEIILYFNMMSSSEATQYDIMPNPMPGYYGQPYDLGSIMHYYPTEVMTARDGRRAFLMGQRVALSFLDSKLANLGYHCGDQCDPKPACSNEGYVNQYCTCTCPDGFFGDQCDLLQGYLATTRLLPSGVPSSTPKEVEHSTMSKNETSTTDARWLEWSDWSNCSEPCGSGVRVRTRLCSSTAVDGSSGPCSSLGGDSFEIESCQSAACSQSDIIMSCTFDLADEKCPLKDRDHLQIQAGTHKDQTRPISDHTRGDGKYLMITGNNIQFEPFTYSNSSKEENHCLQFWYFIQPQGAGKLSIAGSKTNDSFIVQGKDQDPSWKQIQQTISIDDDKLILSYASTSAEYHRLAIDDISVINGACPSKKNDNRRRRKRRQTSTSCSRIIDLTSANTVADITSPSYPNLYPTNARCYYYIRAPQSYRVILQFTDFNVPTTNQNTCDDVVEVRYYNLGQPGPKYCGTGANSNNLRFTSSKNYIMVVFRSDQNYAGRGFRAQALLA